MEADSVQTSAPRWRLVLLAALFCATVLCGSLYTSMRPSGLPRKMKIVPKLLKNKGRQQLPLGGVTIVTAYINIGPFQKGEGTLIYKPSDYHDWMTTFHLIKNPVIAFFENDQDIENFKAIRKTVPTSMTKVVKISRNNTWAFSLRPLIDKIFSQPSYPKHHPNTVVPDYSCAVHAKYDFMEMALKENPFNTKYFAWLDIGLFRDLVKSEQPFTIHEPPKFNDQKVGYTEVYPKSNTSMTAKQLVEGNQVWVCGCYFVARYDVMLRWTKQYRAFTEKMLKENWMSTDQQVLYYMFQPQHNQSALMDVHIQPYKPDGHFNPWFHLAYMSSKPWKN